METAPLTPGTPVEKCNSRPDDGHQDGARGLVVRHVGPAIDDTYGYFVEWADLPDIPVFVAGSRIRPRAAAAGA